MGFVRIPYAGINGECRVIPTPWVVMKSQGVLPGNQITSINPVPAMQMHKE